MEEKLTWDSSLDSVSWDELSELYRLAPLGNKPATRLEHVFSNSMFRCFVSKQGKLVGAGRALADGADCSYICDVAVHPDMQGKGLGKAIIEHLVHLSQGHQKIILYSNPGKEDFYRKLGFLPMTTAMAIFSDSAAALQKCLITD